ncbi:MAG: Rid family detoxifying hydrolase [Duncaniella sp.]|nr:Rid family detoxifying hydrolase [Duncaniella sp.]
MKEAIATTLAPSAIGPYSQAIKCGNLLFCSGQIPVNPADGSVPDGIKAQAEQSLANVAALLNAAGTSMDKVVKTTVFLSDMANFGAMNEVYASFFNPPYPARSAVAVRELPKGVLLEVEVIAEL